jgi:hypothetical protein
LLGIATAAAIPAEESGYIFEIPAQRSPDSTGPLGDYIQATLDFTDPERAAALLAANGAVAVLDVTDRQVVIGVALAATTTAQLEDADLAASFVIDFDEAPVANSAALLRDTYGADPAPREIEQFVFDYIDDKDYRGTFDLASKVARTRSGDCTEHAVLLTALARTHGLPARLVLGLVLVSEADKIYGYGHAWTEVHHAGEWLLLDGTAPAAIDLPGETFYVPLMALSDEGPGYGMDFMRLANAQPARISNIRGANP